MEKVIRKGLKRLGYSDSHITQSRDGAFIMTKDNRSGRVVKIYVADLIDLMIERKMI